jgi:hypothetical protein
VFLLDYGSVFVNADALVNLGQFNFFEELGNVDVCTCRYAQEALVVYEACGNHVQRVFLSVFPNRVGSVYGACSYTEIQIIL